MSTTNPTESQAAVQAAVAELLKRPEVYVALQKALNDPNRTVASVRAALEEVAKEVKVDMDAVLPVITKVMEDLNQGVKSPQFINGSTTSKVLLIVSVLAPVIDALVMALQGTAFGNSVWVTVTAMIVRAIVNYMAKKPA